MPKFYAYIKDGLVEVAGCRDNENLPDEAVLISREHFDYVKKNIPDAIDRNLIGNQVVEKSEEEKEEIRTEKLSSKERIETEYRIGRTTYRHNHMPFDFNEKKIQREWCGDLRKTPHGIFSTHDNGIRDAVMCELAGRSILPIRVWTVDKTAVSITTAEELFALHHAMASSNKVVLEKEIDMRIALTETTKYSDIKEVRALNHDRSSCRE